MPPSETFAKELLEKELKEREEEFDKLNSDLDRLRNSIAICSSSSLYSCLSADKAMVEKRRRELRGEMSALRQAISKLGRPD